MNFNVNNAKPTPVPSQALNNSLYTSNPYGIPIRGQGRQKKKRGDQMDTNSNGNGQPGSAGGNRSNASFSQASQNVKEQNQMIAKIYGKSNKFVVNNQTAEQNRRRNVP